MERGASHTDCGGNVSGNVIVYILIAIALFAALGYAVSASLRGSGAEIGREEGGRVGASAVLDFVRNIRANHQALRLEGVRAGGVSFVRPGEPGFETPPHTHKIFHPGGGGVTYKAPWARLGESAAWHFPENEIAGIGNAGRAEQLAALADVAGNVCLALNALKAGVSTIPDAGGSIADLLVSGTQALDAANCPACEGREILCIRGSGGRLGVYAVIEAR